MRLQYSGKYVLLLGGTCELAVSLAEQLIQAGLYPILTHRNETGLRRISEKLEAFSGRYGNAHLDFNDLGSLNRLFGQEDLRLDYLVDFAQGDFESLIASANEEDIFHFFSENISFRAAVIKRTARLMLANRMGRLVYISSIAAERPNPGQGFYAAAKSASEALYRNLGIELGERGVSTVTLRPGYIEAGRGKEFLEKNRQNVLHKTYLQRALTVEEVNKAVLFYLSDNARGFNGVAVCLDKGLSMGK